MSTLDYDVQRVHELLSMAQIEPRQMYHRTKLSKRFLDRAKDEFPALTTTERRTVYTCLKTLIGRYVKNMDDARTIFPIFRALIPSMFKEESFGAIPTHYFQMRRIFVNHEDQQVADYADELFRKTRAELRADKKKRMEKEKSKQLSQTIPKNGTAGPEAGDPPLPFCSKPDIGAQIQNGGPPE